MTAALLLAGVGLPAMATAQEVVQPLPGTTDADVLAAAVRRLGANPRDLMALIEAGELSVKVGDTNAAAALFKRAEAIDPANGRVKAGIARILVSGEQPGEALRFFDQAQRNGADPALFADDRGLAYDLIGEQERAQRDYRVALARSLPEQDRDEVRRRYALSLGISGRRDEALAQIDALLRRSDRGAWRARAFILAMSGDTAGANRIATGMMPPGMASGLAAFFQRLPALRPADRAFAVHFGEVTATPARLADARLVPPLPALGPDPSAPRVVQMASTTPPPRRLSRSEERRAKALERLRARDSRRQADLAARSPAAVPSGQALIRGGAGGAGIAPVRVASAPATTLSRAPTVAATGPAPLTGPSLATQATLVATAAQLPTPAPTVAAAGSTVSRVPGPSVSTPEPSTAAAGSTIGGTRVAAVPSVSQPVGVAPGGSGVSAQAGRLSASAPVAVAAPSVPVAPPSSGAQVAPATQLAVAIPSPLPGAASSSEASVTGLPREASAVQRSAVPTPGLAAATLAGPGPASVPESVAQAASPPATVVSGGAVAGTVATTDNVPATQPADAGPSDVAAVAPARTQADDILSRIVAGISIPAAELGVAPVTAPVQVASGSGSLDAAAARAARNPIVAERRERLASTRPATRLPEQGADRAARRVAADAGTDSKTDTGRAGRSQTDIGRAGRRGTRATDESRADTASAAKSKDAKSSRGKSLPGADVDADRDVMGKSGRRTAAETRLAASKERAAAKEKDSVEKKAARSEAPRIWVQVAGGANADDLPKAWAAARSKAPALAGRQAYSTPLRATNRVVTGPFKTEAEARAVVNQLSKQGVSAFTFTSTAGQKVTPLKATTK